MLDSGMAANDKSNNIIITKDDLIMNIDQCSKTEDVWICRVEILPFGVNYMS